MRTPDRVREDANDTSVGWEDVQRRKTKLEGTRRKRRRGYLWLVVAILVLTGGCLISVFLSAIKTTPGRVVTGEELGEDWPFSVDGGVVDCRNLSNGLREAVFRSAGVTYALNGTAKSHAEAQGYEDVMSIWRDDPDYQGLKIDIGPILDLALQECE